MKQNIDRIDRHLFTRRTEARRRAAVELVLTLIVFALLGVLMAWRF